MKITAYFNPMRIWYLLKRDVNRLWKDYLITMGGVCGFFLLIFVITAKTGVIRQEMHTGFLCVIFFLLGFIFTSLAFREAHKKLLVHDWLMLPASTLEKLIEKIILYSAGFSVLSVFIYWFFTLLARLVVQVFLGEYFPPFIVFDRLVWQLVGHYLLTQSIFVLGAVWFKNNNFIKTIIAIVLFSIILSVIASFVAWLVFNDYFWTLVRGDFLSNIELSHDFDMERLDVFGLRVLKLVKFTYFGLLAPLCWFGSWLKLRELEVRDGV